MIRKMYRIRSRYGRAAIVRAALIVFALALGLTAAVVYTLDRGARSSNMQQAQTELTGAARVSASEFAALRADLRAKAGELASSLELQRALIGGNRGELQALARTRHARIAVGTRRFDALPRGPMITATATIADGGHALAHVTVARPRCRIMLRCCSRDRGASSQADLSARPYESPTAASRSAKRRSRPAASLSRAEPFSRSYR